MDEHRSVALRVGAKTHCGLVREENQDRISRIQSPFGDVFIVADGMGGHKGGATAAQMLIDGFDEHLRGLPPGAPPATALQEAAALTNAGIYRRAQGADPHLAKMGATGVLALVTGSRAWIAHAGDSRAYLWRNGRLSRLTHDHTLVQRMLDHRILEEEEARDHPDANVVTRAFGQKPDIELDVARPFDLYDGDRLILCSDGLSGYVDDDVIAHLLTVGGEAQAVTEALIDLALQAGGEDNVSVQLIAVQGESPRMAAPAHALAAPLSPEEMSAPVPRRGFLGLLLVPPLILVAFLAGILLPWRVWLPPEPSETAEPEPAVSDSPVTDVQSSTETLAETSALDADIEPGTRRVMPEAEEGQGSRTSAAAPEAEPPTNLPEKEEQPAATTVVRGGLGASTGAPSRLKVLLPERARAPEIPLRIAQSHPGNWSTPERLGGRPAQFLTVGHVYYRRGFAQQATDLAGELDYKAFLWPREVETAWGEAKVLVVLRPRSRPPGT